MTPAPAVRRLERNEPMQYVLTGFTQDVGFRVFAFDGLGEDRVRTEYKVRADLALIRRYGIRVQELPLLCRGLLERRDPALEQRTFTYSEDDMAVHLGVCAERDAAAQKKRAARRPPTTNLGAG